MSWYTVDAKIVECSVFVEGTGGAPVLRGAHLSADALVAAHVG